MAPLRGWAPQGRRLEARVPHAHWQTTTFIAALRCERITAPIVFDGPISLRATVLLESPLAAAADRTAQWSRDRLALKDGVQEACDALLVVGLGRPDRASP